MSSSVQAQTQINVPYESLEEASLLSRPEGYGYHVMADATTQSLLVKGDQERLEWSLVDDSNTLTLRWPQRSAPPLPALLAAIEGAFTFYPATVALRLRLPLVVHDNLCAFGIAVKDSQGELWAYAELFWQLPTLWLTSPPCAPTPSNPSWRTAGATRVARHAHAARSTSAIFPGSMPR